LRNIREHLAETEPRFDPAVIPLRDASQKTPLVENWYIENEAFLRPPLQSVGGSSVPIRYSVAHYRALYLSSQLTPLTVVETILPLIQRDLSPPGEHSTAWIDIKVALVIKAAEESTLRYKEKRSLGPLDGIPVAVKDEYDVRGYATTLGSANESATDEAKEDSWCIQMLKEAGAIIMGKATMVEYGMGKVSLGPSHSINLYTHTGRHLRQQSCVRDPA
jgi:hypothetical protein